MNIIKYSLTAFTILVLLVGCGEGTTDNENVTIDEPSSEFLVEYGMYGVNNDLGTSETIRITWIRKSTVPSSLYLTSNIDSASDPILESKYGSPHYHYTIDKVDKPGTYHITCEPATRTGLWTEFSCLRDGTFIVDQDTSIDNGFVLATSGGSNRVFDAKTTTTDTLGFIVHP